MQGRSAPRAFRTGICRPMLPGSLIGRPLRPTRQSCTERGAGFSGICNRASKCFARNRRQAQEVTVLAHVAPGSSSSADGKVFCSLEAAAHVAMMWARGPGKKRAAFHPACLRLQPATFGMAGPMRSHAGKMPHARSQKRAEVSASPLATKIDSVCPRHARRRPTKLASQTKSRRST